MSRIHWVVYVEVDIYIFVLQLFFVKKKCFMARGTFTVNVVVKDSKNTSSSRGSSDLVESGASSKVDPF
jgi:hypothetical protein